MTRDDRHLELLKRYLASRRAKAGQWFMFIMMLFSVALLLRGLLFDIDVYSNEADPMVGVCTSLETHRRIDGSCLPRLNV